MILAGCVIGIMYRITSEFDTYLNEEIKKRKIPIKGNHSALFMILHDKNDKMEFKDLASTWKKSKSTLCDITSKYFDQGLLEKIGCCTDKRHVYLRLSPEGRKYAIVLEEIAKDFLDKATEGLSNEQKDELKVILKQIKSNLIKG